MVAASSSEKSFQTSRSARSFWRRFQPSQSRERNEDEREEKEAGLEEVGTPEAETCHVQQSDSSKQW